MEKPQKSNIILKPTILWKHVVSEANSFPQIYFVTASESSAFQMVLFVILGLEK